MTPHQQGYEAYKRNGGAARNPFRGVDAMKRDQWQAGFTKAYREHSQ